MARVVLCFDVGVRNLGFCRLSVTGALVSLVNATTFQLVDESVNVTQTSIGDIVDAICAGFDSLMGQCLPEHSIRDRGTPPPDEVIIEEQPVNLGRRSVGNIKMKVVSHVIQALIKSRFPTITVKFVDSSIKFTEMPATVNRADYRARKRFGVEQAQRLVQSGRILDPDGHLARAVAIRTKADDVCDSVLLGYYGLMIPPRAPRAPRAQRVRKRQRLAQLEAPDLTETAPAETEQR